MLVCFSFATQSLSGLYVWLFTIRTTPLRWKHGLGMKTEWAGLWGRGLLWVCLRISAVTTGIMESLLWATASKEHLAESLHISSAHKHITGITGLPCSAPVFNHYICTHSLSYHLTGTSKEESRKKERREKVRKNHIEFTCSSLSAHWKNEKQHNRKQKPVREYI